MKPDDHRDAQHRSAPSSKVVHEALMIEAHEELARPSAALFWSGLAAGLSLGFSLVVEGILHASLPESDWRPLVAKLGYGAGFLIVILGRQQLFTENTLTPMLPVLRERKAAPVRAMLRLWIIVLGSNLIGAAAFGIVIAQSHMFAPDVQVAFRDIGLKALEPGFGMIVLRGIFAGWLVALLIWMLPFAESSRVFIILLLAWIIGVGELSHVIAGSVDVFALAAAGHESWGRALASFTLPSLIGNIIGGCLLVAALNHKQVVAGEPR